jgi:tetratricopeptide (TPR) repeat protein
VMLETIHEFAREKLKESGETEELRRQHAEYFLTLAEEAEPQVEGPQQAAWLDRLEEEHDNMRAALSWSLGQGEDAEMGLRMCAALGEFWYWQGHFGEGLRWLEEALAKSSPAPRAARAKALYRVSWLALLQGDLDRAIEAGEEGLELEGVERFRTASGDSTASNLRRALAMAVGNRGELDRAMELLEESLALSREAGSTRGAAHSLWALGVTCMLGGELDRATELLEEALTLWRASGDPAIIAGILTHLGQTLLLQGDLERATAVSEEAASMLRERKNRNHYLAEALENLGWAALLQGNPEQANALFAEGLGLRRELGDKLTAPNTLEALASAAAAQGEAERTARLYGVVEKLNEVMGTPQDAGEDALTGPYFAAARSQLDEATWQEAWAEGRAMTLEEAIFYALEEEEARG